MKVVSRLTPEMAHRQYQVWVNTVYSKEDNIILKIKELFTEMGIWEDMGRDKTLLEILKNFPKDKLKLFYNKFVI